MSAWGFLWGDPWGDATLAASDRLLNFVRAPRNVAITNIVGIRTEELLSAGEMIRDAFDLDSATGDRLDKLGGILQFVRPSGMIDDRYRLLLQIQVELILSSNGTPETIMRIIELYTGSPPTSYSEHYPMGFVVGFANDGTLDVPTLLQLLNKARAAAYTGTAVSNYGDSMILDYTLDTPVDGAGTLDYLGTIPGAGTLAYPYPF